MIENNAVADFIAAVVNSERKRQRDHKQTDAGGMADRARAYLLAEASHYRRAVEAAERALASRRG
jgi:hypothetical protein